MVRVCAPQELAVCSVVSVLVRANGVRAFGAIVANARHKVRIDRPSRVVWNEIRAVRSDDDGVHVFNVGNECSKKEKGTRSLVFFICVSINMETKKRLIVGRVDSGLE